MNLLARLWEIDAESFKGKLSLLVLDKLLVGAIIALAFVAYDRYRTSDQQSFASQMTQLAHELELERGKHAASREERAAQIQREFQRARLGKDLLPFILDNNSDVVARGYVLQSALSTGLVDPEAAIEISHTLHEQGLPDRDIRRIANVALPDGLAALARHGARLRDEWIRLWEHPHSVSSSDAPNIRPALAEVAKERVLWSTIAREALPGFDVSAESRILSRRFFREHLSGLYFLLHVYSAPGSARLLQSSSRALRLIGSLDCVIMNWGAQLEAAEYIGAEFSALGLTRLDDINYARALIDVLKVYDVTSVVGHAGIAPQISVHLARLLVDDSFHHHIPWIADEASAEQRQRWFGERDAASAHSSLQYEAGEVLMRIGNRAQNAEVVLVSFIEQFYRDVATAEAGKPVNLLRSRYGKHSVRFVISVLGAINTPGANSAIRKVKSLGDDKLKAFEGLQMEFEALEDRIK